MVSAAIASNCCVLKHTVKEVNNYNSTFVGGCSLKSSYNISHLLKGSKKSSRLVVTAASGNTTSKKVTQDDSGRFYINFTGFPFPLGPFLNRRTIRTEVCLLPSPFFRLPPSPFALLFTSSFHYFTHIHLLSCLNHVLNWGNNMYGNLSIGSCLY